MTLLLMVGTVLALALVAAATHLLLKWFNRRGWMDYSKSDEPDE